MNISRYRALDFESHLIEPGILAPTPVCFSEAWIGPDGKGSHVKAVCEYLAADLKTYFMRILDDPHTKLIIQNAPFDLMMLVAHYGIPISDIQREIDAGRIACTQIREQLIAIQTGGSVTNIDPRNGSHVKYGLDTLVKTYLKEDISDKKSDPDAWRLRYSELDGVPIEDYPQEAYDYALLDSVYALKVFFHQSADTNWHSFGRFQDPDDQMLIRDEIAQTRCAWDLYCMAAHGPYVDQEEAAIFEAHHTKEAEKAQGGVIDVGLLKWNKNKYPKKGPPKSIERQGWSEDQKSLQAAVEADYAGRDMEVPKTATGRVSIAGDVLLGCASKILKGYGEAQGSRKMLSSFVEPLKQAGTKRLTSSPNAIVNTGRTSWRRPNLQQPPKKGGFRECVVPAESNVFCSIDYSAIEMVALAQVLFEKYGNQILMDAINNKKDVHVVFGSQIINKTYDECMAIRKDKSHPDYHLVQTARQAAKPFNFGRAGGMGAETFLSTLDEGVQTALQTIEPGNHLISIVKRLLCLWDDTWNAHQYFRDVGKRVKNGKFCYRHPISGRVRSKVGYCDGCNLQFQGRAADGAKNALRLVSDWLYSTDHGQGHNKGVTAWAFIHDEILFEGPEETVTEWAQVASELMVAGMQPYLKDLRVEAEPAAMRRWIKEAEPFYEDGKLIPWDREFVPVGHDIPEHLDVLSGPYYAHPDYVEVKGPETELDKIYEMGSS